MESYDIPHYNSLAVLRFISFQVFSIETKYNGDEIESIKILLIATGIPSTNKNFDIL